MAKRIDGKVDSGKRGSYNNTDSNNTNLNNTNTKNTTQYQHQDACSNSEVKSLGAILSDSLDFLL